LFEQSPVLPVGKQRVYSVGNERVALVSRPGAQVSRVVYNGALYFVADNPFKPAQDLYSSTAAARTILKRISAAPTFCVWAARILQQQWHRPGEITGASALDI